MNGSKNIIKWSLSEHETKNIYTLNIMPNSCTFFKYPDFKPFVRLENATLTLKYQTLILKFAL